MEPTVIYDFDPRNLPQDTLAAIGLVVTTSAMLEYTIEQGIAGCLGVDFEYGAAVTTHMAVPLRDSVLRSVAEIKINDLDDLDELDDLLEEAKNAFDKRNAIVHREWCIHPITNKVFTVKETARTRYEADLVPMRVNEIKGDAAFIYRVGLTLYDFFSRRGLIPSIPSHPRPRHHKSKAARKKRRETKLKGTSA